MLIFYYLTKGLKINPENNEKDYYSLEKITTFSTLVPPGELTSTQTCPNGQLVSLRQPAIHTPLFPPPDPAPSSCKKFQKYYHLNHLSSLLNILPITTFLLLYEV